MSRKYHPDKNPGDDTAAAKVSGWVFCWLGDASGTVQFIEISEARDVLSDTQKKQLYDRFGKGGIKMAEMITPNQFAGMLTSIVM